MSQRLGPAVELGRRAGRRASAGVFLLQRLERLEPWRWRWGATGRRHGLAV